MHLAIMYSSGAGFMGSPGQSNHSSANLNMESQAAFRCMLGLPGGSIAWGAVAEIGYAARHDLAKGDFAVPYDHAWAVMEALHCMPSTNVCINPGSWAAGMGRTPMKAAIYMGTAGRFRPSGPKKTATYAISSSRSMKMTEAEKAAAIAEAEEEAERAALAGPSADDPAMMEYKAVFAVMQAVHDSWNAGLPGGVAQKELPTEMKFGAQEVC